MPEMKQRHLQCSFLLKINLWILIITTLQYPDALYVGNIICFI